MSNHVGFLQVGPKTYQCLRCPAVITERWETRTDERRAHAYGRQQNEEADE